MAAVSRFVAQTICFDLDGTLCTNTFGDYEAAEPFAWAIERLNDLASAGHRIIIFTARGTATGLDWSDVTRAQLERWGASYHDLQFGKPNAAVFVDDRAVHTDAWRTGDAFALPGIVANLGGEDGAELLPAPIPSCVTTVVETGRTFAGTPLRLDEHVQRLRERAGIAGLRRLPVAADLRAAVVAALGRAAGREADDIIYTVTLSDARGAAYIDTIVQRPVSSAQVAVRRLCHAVAGLAPLLRDGAEPSVAAVTDGLKGWPLDVAENGTVSDGLGGRLAAVRNGEVIAESVDGPASVAVTWARELAASCGIAITERALTREDLAAADEILLVGTPFCLLPVGVVDGRELPIAAPGPIARRLIAAWSSQAGIGVATQIADLVARPDRRSVVRQ